MRTFQEFVLIAEASYDASVMSSSQIRRTGAGGRVGAERKKTTPEIRRTKRTGGGQTTPSTYKPRADIGQQKAASERQQQPEQERGSARERQLAAAKEERRRAALARRAGTAAPKPKAKDLEKQATKLLAKGKAPKPAAKTGDERFSSSRRPEEHMVKGKYTKAEKKKVVRAGKRLHRDIVKGVEKPASHYQP